MDNNNVVMKLMRSLVSITNEQNQPSTLPLNEQLRDMSALRWNVKVMGALLAKILYQHPDLMPPPESETPFSMGWQATKAEDYSKKWFFDACRKLKIAPILHRKVWELAYVLKTLETTGKLSSGMKGIGFGCGEESFPSYFASRGVQILATDLDPRSQQAQGWVSTNQHTANLDKAFKPDFISRPDFDSRVSFSHADMNDIPKDLHGQFDFCWSVCAFEHLGSIQKGLNFVRESVKLLKPGGIAVHTTEFNYSEEEKTIDNWGTVLFRKKDFMALKESLEKDGHEVPPLSFDVGKTPLDWFIDVPPYPGEKGYFDDTMASLHLKLMVDGFPSTCYGVVVRRR
jgi:2-polyprenyl-3-methyl-5-hydroxy-6-metoxy-1,4-benzoquinol methylase